jgi:guanosine-3',5'-bis(diphosphate) 3'-pyrophosphohydrolase
MTQPGHEPSKDWLAFVKTSRARNKIKHVINASERVKAIEIGQKYLDKEARRLGVQLSKVTKADLEKSGRRVRLQQDGRPVRRAGLRQVLGAPGAEQRSLPGVVKDDEGPAGAVAEPGARPPPGAPPRPAPGRGRRRRRRHQGPRRRRPAGLPRQVLQPDPRRGHRRLRDARQGRRGAFPMCPNVQSLMYDVERKIEVEWARAADDAFPVRIVVHTDDRPGMLNQLTSVLSDENTNIRSLEAKGETWTTMAAWWR